MKRITSFRIVIVTEYNQCFTRLDGLYSRSTMLCIFRLGILFEVHVIPTHIRIIRNHFITRPVFCKFPNFRVGFSSGCLTNLGIDIGIMRVWVRYVNSVILIL